MLRNILCRRIFVGLFKFKFNGNSQTIGHAVEMCIHFFSLLQQSCREKDVHVIYFTLLKHRIRKKWFLN